MIALQPAPGVYTPSQPIQPPMKRQDVALLRQQIAVLERMLCRPLPAGERPALRDEYCALRALEDACV
jgi:hypothetical protein